MGALARDETTPLHPPCLGVRLSPRPFSGLTATLRRRDNA